MSAKREIVEDYISLGETINMKVSVTDSDIAALLNIFEQQYPEMPEISVIINLGAFSSQVIFVADGAYCFSRDLSVGCDRYTKSISERLGISEEEAEKIKIDFSNDNLLAEGASSGSSTDDASNNSSGENNNTLTISKMQ